MANVNISVQDGALMIVPWTVPIGGIGGDVTIIWNLAPVGGWQFSTDPPGIVCETNPPAGYTAWNTNPAAPGPGANKYNATAGALFDPPPQKFKYSIHLVNGTQRIDIDPEIMNDPQPHPTPDSGGKEPHEGGKKKR